MLGVQSPSLENAAVEIIMRVRTTDGEGTLAVPIMHPLHCLQSRIANVVTLHRKQDVARRQLEAAPIVLREYVAEMLDLGLHREATSTLEGLFKYLRSDVTGKQAHKVMTNDPARILDHFADDARIDEREQPGQYAPHSCHASKRLGQNAGLDGLSSSHKRGYELSLTVGLLRQEGDTGVRPLRFGIPDRPKTIWPA